ncbi:hypothetical protein JHK87_019168 [Glycine soja]|nr:hypothetical protein JHK87_019168 [Glycine soja]
MRKENSIGLAKSDASISIQGNAIDKIIAIRPVEEKVKSKRKYSSAPSHFTRLVTRRHAEIQYFILR